jgi:H+/Cl- antiporter ClcA
VFLDAYQMPPYSFEDWQLLAGVPLGLFAALLVTLLVAFIRLASRLFGRLKLPGIAKSTLGGAVFGLVGVALPLTMFSGSDQLKTVLTDAGTLGLGLLIAILIAKMLTFAVSQGSGFVGGPIFPSLFPGVPLGLAFSCLLAAVPGSVAPASLSMVLLAAFLTQVGALQTAPILIAVITALLTMEGVRYLVTIRNQSRAAAAQQPASPNGPAPNDDRT